MRRNGKSRHDANQGGVWMRFLRAWSRTSLKLLWRHPFGREADPPRSKKPKVAASRQSVGLVASLALPCVASFLASPAGLIRSWRVKGCPLPPVSPPDFSRHCLNFTTSKSIAYSPVVDL